MQDATRRLPIEDLVGASTLRLITHELRQPLTAALGSSLALSDAGVRRELDAGDEQFLLDIVQRNLRQLDALLDMLHVYGELESGNLKPHLVPVPLRDLLRASKEAFDPLRGGTIEVVVECDDYVSVEVDPILMNQVLFNLLGNAKKFSPPGSRVWLDGRLVDGQAVISVSDQGEGVPVEHRVRIFEAGVSGDHARGLGLGLYISNAIVHAHGGRMWIDEAAEGSGARFNVALQPLQRRPPSLLAPWDGNG